MNCVLISFFSLVIYSSLLNCCRCHFLTFENKLNSHSCCWCNRTASSSISVHNVFELRDRDQTFSTTMKSTWFNRFRLNCVDITKMHRADEQPLRENLCGTHTVPKFDPRDTKPLSPHHHLRFKRKQIRRLRTRDGHTSIQIEMVGQSSGFVMKVSRELIRQV